jgi:hypothetical protein
VAAHTVDSVCARLRAQPGALGARSPLTLNAYIEGYAAALAHHRVGELVDELGHEAFRAWIDARVVMADQHASSLNARSVVCPETFALLLSEDEHAAFETFIELRLACRRELGAAARAMPHQPWSEDASLFDMIRLVRARPGMYFGNGRVENAWSLVNGYLAAEADHGLASLQAARMRDFQPWVEQRYPFARGQPWFRAFRFVAALRPDEGIAAFSQDFELFVSGAPPDAPDPMTATLIANIVRHANRE